MIAVTGKTQPTSIYEVLGEPGKVSDARHNAAERYEAALALYLARDFGGAAAGFREIADSNPDDGPCRVMLARCERYLAEPPPDD